MLLDNYYKLFRLMVTSSHNSSTSSTSIPSAFRPITTSGTTVSSYTQKTPFQSRSLMWSPLYNGIRAQNAGYSSGNLGEHSDILIGTGSTAAQASNYKMESQITTNIACTAVGFTISDDCKRYTVTKTFQNTSEEGLVIREIGFMAGCNEGLFLVAREVLAEPLTVEAGKVFNISFTFDF